MITQTTNRWPAALTWNRLTWLPRLTLAVAAVPVYHLIRFLPAFDVVCLLLALLFTYDFMQQCASTLRGLCLRLDEMDAGLTASRDNPKT